MTAEEILNIFKETGALLEGHFVLTSGLHSPTYFQCARVLQYPDNAERLCGEIVRMIRGQSIDLVISPALGGIIVGQEVARQLNVRSLYAERANGLMQLRRGFEIRPGERVLVCEDVITTGGSVREIIDLITRDGGTISGIRALVDRCGGRTSFENFRALISIDVVTYVAADCPLCQRKIPVEKPGSRALS